jgi:Ethanolamine utilization protein EutJ (predicted chaperonin)
LFRNLKEEKEEEKEKEKEKEKEEMIEESKSKIQEKQDKFIENSKILMLACLGDEKSIEALSEMFKSKFSNLKNLL